jgi:hypothetical protein
MLWYIISFCIYSDLCVQYERQAVKDWIDSKLGTLTAAQQEFGQGDLSKRTTRMLEVGIPSPLGHGPLPSLELYSSRAMKRLVDKWRDENPGW